MSHKTDNHLAGDQEAGRPAVLSQKGFTFIEVLLAIAIFSLGVLAAASSQTDAVYRTNAIRKAAEANECATDTMEKLFRLNFNHADLAEGTHTPGGAFFDTNGDGFDDGIPVVPDYNSMFSIIQWEVVNDDLDGDLTDDAKVITVTVEWGNNRGMVLTGVRTLVT